ncbi:MAG: energy transducer TonB [Gemmatimonadota bacterium]|nr:energy transducer TonB [Gemmatimonadota bacterium]
MFKNLPSTLGVRKSVWTPSTIMVSVAIHAAVLGGVYSSVNAADEAEKKVKEEQLVMLEIKPEPPAPPPEPVEPPPPPPPEPEPEPEPKPVPKAPRPVVTPPTPKPAPKPQVAKGTQTVRPPVKPPIGIPAEDRNARAVNLDDFSGKGREGGVAQGTTTGTAMAITEKVKAAPPAPPAPPAARVDSSNFVYDAGTVGTPAGLSDSGRRDLGRLLERNYPPNLRDSGVTGQAVMQFVVDENGRVEGSTIKVISSTHDAFGDASRDVLRQARFTPARVGSRKVRMMLQLPITWAVSR